MDFALLFKYLPKLLEGLQITASVLAFSLSLGFVLAIFLALIRIFRIPIISFFADRLVAIFRGTPLLAQLFLVYYGAPQFQETLKLIHIWWIFADSFPTVVFTFTLNTAAYQSEILRGAFLGVKVDQWEAGKSLGMRPLAIFIRIIAPQAFLAALRPFGNEVILMIKGSAVASIVALHDLMGATRYSYSRTYNFQIYIMAAAIYILIVEVFRQIWNKLEQRLSSHLKR